MSSSDTQSLIVAYRDLRVLAQGRADHIERQMEPHWRERRDHQLRIARTYDLRIAELMAQIEEEDRREQSARDACLLAQRGLC